jgi:type I restriction enzyme S subunit
MSKIQLPKDWKWEPLGKVATYLNGRAFKPSEWKDSGKPIIRIQNLNKPNAKYNYTKVEFEERYKVVKGDLLFAWSASLGAYIWKGDEAWLNQHIFKVVPKEITDKTYLFYLLEKIVQELYAKAHGSGMVHVTKGKFEATEIPFPPLPTQQAIVAKIEELFSALDKGIENLRAAQQQLKTYRQSVLKWAFEGKLTNENVQEGKLPMGWNWVKIEDATVSLDNKRKPINKDERKKRQGNIPYYGANGQVGWIDDYIFNEPLVCVVEDETFTGREIPFSYKITGKAWVNNHAHVLKPNDNLNIDYLNYQLFYYPFLRLTTGTTGRKKLTKNALSNAPIKICSLEEQHQIVQAIESRLSVADKMEESITQSLQQSEALRQSILKKAFEGRLVINQ